MRARGHARVDRPVPVSAAVELDAGPARVVAEVGLGGHELGVGPRHQGRGAGAHQDDRRQHPEPRDDRRGPQVRADARPKSASGRARAHAGEGRHALPERPGGRAGASSGGVRGPAYFRHAAANPPLVRPGPARRRAARAGVSLPAARAAEGERDLGRVAEGAGAEPGAAGVIPRQGRRADHLGRLSRALPRGDGGPAAAHRRARRAARPRGDRDPALQQGLHPPAGLSPHPVGGARRGARGCIDGLRRVATLGGLRSLP